MKSDKPLSERPYMRLLKVFYIADGWINRDSLIEKSGFDKHYLEGFLQYFIYKNFIIKGKVNNRVFFRLNAHTRKHFRNSLMEAYPDDLAGID